MKTHMTCHSGEPKGDEESRQGRAIKAGFPFTPGRARFLALLGMTLGRGADWHGGERFSHRLLSACVKTHMTCHSEEPKGDEESRQGRAFKTRFPFTPGRARFLALLGMTLDRGSVP